MEFVYKKKKLLKITEHSPVGNYEISSKHKQEIEDIFRQCKSGGNIINVKINVYVCRGTGMLEASLDLDEKKSPPPPFPPFQKRWMG
jgi:hypothetical protein